MQNNVGSSFVFPSLQCDINASFQLSDVMAREVQYTEEPLGDLKVVSDFLPRPEDLVFRVQKTKSKRGLGHGQKSS